MSAGTLYRSVALGVALLAACSDDDAPADDVRDAQTEDGGKTDGGAAEEDASEGDTKPDASTPDAGERVGKDGFLLVAELGAGVEAIHAYSLPELRHTGQLDGVKLGNHLGAIALEDGRVITSDDKNQEIIAIALDAQGKPSIVDRVSADLGTGAVWGCGDEALKYLAISSGREGTGPQVANIVRLEDFSLTPFEVPMNLVNGNTEELHAAIAGEPLQLFASVGGELRAYPLDAVLAGQNPAPGASVTIETGSHGPVVAHEDGTLYITTRAGTGFDGIMTEAPFARAKLIPWDVDGRSTGRNARPRLATDGRTIYGAIALTEPTGAELWATREVDFQAVDLASGVAKRSLLTTGIVSKFQLSSRYALFANVTADKDQALLVDVERGSSTYHQVVARVELPRLGNGPVAGQASTGKQALGSAITPDGRWAFVSHGGEGKVSVIDTDSKTVVGTIETPSALNAGGYLFAVQPGTRPVDTCTR